jgi:hypothetical protein
MVCTSGASGRTRTERYGESDDPVWPAAAPVLNRGDTASDSGAGETGHREGESTQAPAHRRPHGCKLGEFVCRRGIDRARDGRYLAAANSSCCHTVILRVTGSSGSSGSVSRAIHVIKTAILATNISEQSPQDCSSTCR